MRSSLNIWTSRLILVIAYGIGVCYTLLWLWVLLLGDALIDDKPAHFIPQPFVVSLGNSLWIYLTVWSGVVIVQVLLRWRTALHPRWWVACWVAFGLSQWIGFWTLVGLLQLSRDGLLVLISWGVLFALAARIGLERVAATIDTLGAGTWVVIYGGTMLSLWLLAMRG